MPNEEFYKRVPVAVPHKSGFDKSFRNLFTAKCGTLVPIFCDEVIPNTSVHLDLALSAQLPPLASETFMNVDYKVEAFFCPTRLLMANYEDWLSRNDTFKNAAGTTTKYLRAPIVQFTPNQAAPGTLLDYLGVMSSGGIAMTANSVASAFPILAYHLIWNDWYRSSLVQKSIYMSKIENDVLNFGNGYCPAFMKWWTPEEANNDYILTSNTLFADNSSPLDLRQRNFGLDYFTMATPSAQNGDVQKVSMQLPNQMSFSFIKSNSEVDVNGDKVVKSGTTGSSGYFGINNTYTDPVTFTIPALRAVNSMQQFLERNNLIGNRLVDYVKGQYGATLKDSIAQRPVYLGSFSFPVYSKGVYQSNQETSQDVASQNPFNSVGARYGHAYAEGNGSLIDFTAEEPGYIMVLGSLVPEVTYSSGVEAYMSRYLARGSQSDMANPILQNVGNEPIYRKQLDGEIIFDTNNHNNSYGVFGYVERYASWKTRNNQLHGLLRDGQSLDSFALQRAFANAAGLSISSSFLEIPTNFMDQVSAVNGSISNYGVWVDCYFKYGVSMPLYQYSLPSLQDPAWEHGNVFTIPRGGNKID